MELQEYHNFVRKNFEPRNQKLYLMRDEIFEPALVQAVRLGTPDALLHAGEEIHPGVFAFDMFHPDFCRELLDEVAWFESWCGAHDLAPLRPNTMNNYGAILDAFGFYPFLQQLMIEYVQPFASLLYADVGGAALDGHHGFLVEYQPGKDTLLDFHVDESDVTLNVCLGKEFTAGTLYFRGIRCRKHQQTEPLPEEEFEVVHRPGRAILHRGKHRHGANPIAGGQRFNLILWCMSSQYRRHLQVDSCPAWCGLHHLLD